MFVHLDLATLIFMSVALNITMGLLLLFASVHRGAMGGNLYWVAAMLFVSFGFGIIGSNAISWSDWRLVGGVTVLIAGMGLQYLGIQKFNRQPLNWALPTTAVIVGFVLTAWFQVIQQNVQARLVLDSIIYIVINVACAKLLLTPAPQPLKTASWFTGCLFVLLTCAYAERMIGVVLNPVSNVKNFNQMAINPKLFLMGCIAQTCLSFGFLLMLNYRMVVNIRELAVRDPLTGIFNRRSLEDEAARLLARCERNKEIMTLMMLDVDHFKAVNDRYGHQVGDEVLIRLVEVINSTVRDGDYAARYGGEEFCILLPLTSQAQALVLAERLRYKWESCTKFYGLYSIRSTVSIGLSDTTVSGLNFHDLVNHADQALYQAKKSGRNCVKVYSEITAA